jgi:hypothetical protein
MTLLTRHAMTRSFCEAAVATCVVAAVFVVAMVVASVAVVVYVSNEACAAEALGQS